MNIWSVIRFLLGLGCLLVAALVLIPAPNVPLFQVKVMATEYGHWCALVALFVMLAGTRSNQLDSVSVAFATISALLFISSSVRAAFTASDVVKGMNEAFPVADSDAPEPPPAFSWHGIWRWAEPEPVDPQTLEYATHESGKLEVDFYPSQVGQPAPCVVVLHTGGWDDGTRHEFLAMNSELARFGYGVAAIDYRFAPQSPWPAQREDLLGSIRFLQNHAEELGIDPKTFVLLGRSAGGQIAEAVAYEGVEPAIKGCIAFYAPADMHFAFKYADAKDILNSAKLLRQFLGGTPEEAQINYDGASGILHVKAESVPTLLIHGRQDEMVWVKQSQRLAEQLKSVGAKYDYVELPWATHAFDYNFNGPGGQISRWAVERFLERVAPNPRK